MRLAVRNRLAEICLAAVTDAVADPPLRALLAFAQAADVDGVARGLDDRDGALLLGMEGLFEAWGTALRLRPDLLGDLGALKERAERIAGAVAACHSRCGASPDPARRSTRARGSATAPGAEEIRWVLCAASVLFNAELFFEVHEILEPYWSRADPRARSFLQGLIQVAVGFHHRANGNRRGALALLASGGAKLARFVPAAYGLDLESFCRAVGEIAGRSPGGGGGTYEAAAPKLFLRSPPGQRSEITR